MTPYFQTADRGITLYHGDCRDVLPTLPPAPLLVTDIPYGLEHHAASGRDQYRVRGHRVIGKADADVETIPLAELIPLLVGATTGSLYVWCSSEQAAGLRTGFEAAGLSTRLCIWEKTNPTPLNGESLWLRSVEVCVYGRRPKAPFNRFCASPVWRGPSERVPGHRTPKPVWLMCELIAASSAPGDVVIDPLVGSGTTLVAAKKLGRRGIGVELRERYCEIAASRLAQQVLPLETTG